MTRQKPRYFRRTFLFGVLGVVVFLVSALAVYGGVSGYGKYVTAAKKLAFDVDNVTVRCETYLFWNGEEKNRTAAVYRRDGRDFSVYNQNSFATAHDHSGRYSSCVDGIWRSFYADDDFYTVGEASAGDDFGVAGYRREMAPFADLFADIVFGDLKNNVVPVEEKEGVSTYALNVRAEQMPALAKSALNLFGSANGLGGQVLYADDIAALEAFYEKKYGEPLPADILKVAVDQGSGNAYGPVSDSDLTADRYGEAEWDRWQTLYREMQTAYEAKRRGQGDPDRAILFVAADGEAVPYESYSAYACAQNVAVADLADLLTEESALDSIDFRFSLDEKGRLRRNDCVLTFAVPTADGAVGEVRYTMALTAEAYGETQVFPFDSGDRRPELPDGEWDEALYDKFIKNDAGLPAVTEALMPARPDPETSKTEP